MPIAAAPVIGSMAIKGIFKGGGLLSGLGSTAGKLKEVQQRSKSTTTEMQRMTKGAHQVRNALALIGVGGFSALLMTTPQLAGSLAKIKNNMMLIAWSVGKHLKPALEAVNTILTGIRTGDWSTVIQGVKDLGAAVGTILLGAWEKVKTAIYDALMSNKYLADFTTWIESLITAWNDGDLVGVIKIALLEPFQWLWDNGKTLFDDIVRWGKWCADELIKAFDPSKLPLIGPMIGFTQRLIDREMTGGWSQGTYGEGQVGIGSVPRTGMYKLHAGETVTMKGSTQSGGSGSSNITVDFSGANISLGGGVQLDEFANAISMKIAERQQSLSY